MFNVIWRHALRRKMSTPSTFGSLKTLGHLGLHTCQACISTEDVFLWGTKCQMSGKNNLCACQYTYIYWVGVCVDLCSTGLTFRILNNKGRLKPYYCQLASIIKIDGTFVSVLYYSILATCISVGLSWSMFQILKVSVWRQHVLLVCVTQTLGL